MFVFVVRNSLGQARVFVPRHALHDKGLQRQVGVDLQRSQQLATKSKFRPVKKSLVKR